MVYIMCCKIVLMFYNIVINAHAKIAINTKPNKYIKNEQDNKK